MNGYQGSMGSPTTEDSRGSTIRVVERRGRPSIAVEEMPHTRNILHQTYRNIHDTYKLYKQLGAGQFGMILACLERETGCKLACKVIRKSQLRSPQDAMDVKREVEALREVSGHPNVINLKETIEDSKGIYIIMERCFGGDLYSRIVNKDRYCEREAAELFCTLASVVEHCHNQGVMHRDLKPENIMLCSRECDVHIKVIDFGLAVFFEPGQKFYNCAGSAYYVAPEVLLGEYGPEADVWSIGVILYILLCGWPPFSSDDKDEIYFAIEEGEYDLSRGIWSTISDSAKDLVSRILVTDPKERLTLDEILDHPWLQQYNNFKPLEELPQTEKFAPVNSGESLSSSQLSYFSPRESKVWPVCEAPTNEEDIIASGALRPTNPLHSQDVIHCV